MSRRAALAALVVAAVTLGRASAARADYCVGTACGAAAGGNWHKHGCWDFERTPAGNLSPQVGCFARVAECWDQSDATCEILSEWGYRLDDQQCEAAPHQVTAGDFCGKYLKEELGRAKARREAEAKEKELAAEFGNTIAPPGGDGTAAIAPVVAPPPGQSPPPAPRRVNPWTPQAAAPFAAARPVTLVDFNAKAPCAICVEFHSRPPVDAVMVAQQDPRTAAAATAAIDDARSYDQHVTAQLQLQGALGVVATTTAAAAPGAAPIGPPPVSSPPVLLTDPSRPIAPSATDDGAIDARRYLLDNVGTGDAIRDAGDKVAERQRGWIAQQSQRAAGQVMGAAADTADNQAFRTSPPVSVGEVVMKLTLQVGPERYTWQDAGRDTLNVGIDAVNRKLIDWTGRPWVPLW